MAWRYGWFAERYRWPPSVVDEQPLWVINLFPLWARAVDEATERAQEDAQRDAERKAATKR